MTYINFSCTYINFNFLRIIIKNNNYLLNRSKGSYRSGKIKIVVSQKET